MNSFERELVVAETVGEEPGEAGCACIRGEEGDESGVELERRPVCNAAFLNLFQAVVPCSPSIESHLFPGATKHFRFDGPTLYNDQNTPW